MAAANELKPEDLPEFPEMDDSGTIDIQQIEYNLTLTPAQRLANLDEWVRFTRMAHRAFRERHGIDPADLLPPE